mmetsp:Transcript_26137/g.60748  ORF Transcript_26137/g.60748 Transcript_26137/m.60748 type:complete len:362 (-) Transcript_26137:869-1954(-)
MPRVAVGRRSGDHSNDPLWFTAGYLPKKKQFQIKLSMERDTLKTMKATIAKKQPWLSQKPQLEKAKKKQKAAHEVLEQAKRRLADLEEKREQALRDVQEVRQAQMQEALSEVEETLNEQYQIKLKEKEEKWKKEYEEMERRMETEISAKRKQLNTEAKEPEAKRSKQEEDAEPEVDVANDADLIALEKKREMKSQEVKALQEKAEALTERKGDMVWLLKEVCSADYMVWRVDCCLFLHEQCFVLTGYQSGEKTKDQGTEDEKEREREIIVGYSSLAAVVCIYRDVLCCKVTSDDHSLSCPCTTEVHADLHKSLVRGELFCFVKLRILHVVAQFLFDRIALQHKLSFGKDHATSQSQCHVGG